MEPIKAFFFAALISTLTAQSSFAIQPDSRVNLSTIAFGSCNMQVLSQNYWNAIRELEPELWIWGGDNIYADKLSMKMRESEYHRQKKAPQYAKFAEAAMIIGTWDDHDYASDNMGKNFADKVESQRMALDFLDEPSSSARRTQEGLYTSYYFGDSTHLTKVILLDERYFRDDPGPTSDVLGAAQWKWLERELIENPAELTLLMSSSQIFPDEHDGDTWAQYPLAREKMVDLLREAHGKILVLSGDRHSAEISQIPIAPGHTIYEFTASGLTHARWGSTKNRFRVGPFWKKKNFGILKLNWNKYPVEVTMEVHADSGEVVYTHVY